MKRQQARLAWHRKSLVEAYQTVGNQRSAWDTPALEALELFAEVRSLSTPITPEVKARLKKSLEAAVSAGCNDPMIGYLHVRFVLGERDEDELMLSRKMRVAAAALNVSDYDSLARFYACMRATQMARIDIGPDRQVPEDIHRVRHAMTTNMMGVLRDRTVPVFDVYEATSEWRHAAMTSARQYMEDLRFIEAGLKVWGDDPLILLARAECGIGAAWCARGSGYADTVTPEGWKLFNDRLTESKKMIEQAWKGDASEARICNAMLEVATGLSFKRPEMEKWFERAMKLDTNNYSACEAKLHYLKPQWLGSPGEMAAFGRQCLTKPWGGQVPLTLVDAHQVIAALLPEPQKKEYWKAPEVWQDVERSFTKFFALNPDATGSHHNLAWYALHAGRWKTFQEQLPFFTTTNYAYFGGRAEFDRLVKAAEEGSK